MVPAQFPRVFGVDNMRVMRSFLTLTLLLVPAVALATSPFPISMGTSWDGISLQAVLDAEYGVGVIDVMTDYEGYLAGDADPAYWEDFDLDGMIVREIAGYADTNVMGWYAETLSSAPAIDGVDDGVVFTGPMSPGATAFVVFPAGLTRFGLYLNPNGPGNSGNAAEPEIFFSNRFYNDIGPNGAAAAQAPFDGDVQCLVFNITHLNNGVPTYVIAWEDLDSGAQITPTYTSYGTDNDYNDLVVEIRADSPVPTESTSWSKMKALYQN